MPKYVKKAVQVDAWPATDLIRAAATDWAALPKPVVDSYERGGWVFFHDRISVPTAEGSREALKGDMVLQEADGRFTVSKHEAFAANYAAVQE